MIREIHSPKFGNLKIRLPDTVRELAEFRVFICAHAEDEPEAFIYLAAQWAARYTLEHKATDLVEWARASGVEALSMLCEHICIVAGLPDAVDRELEDRYAVLFELDPDAEPSERSAAMDNAHPWVIEALKLAFAVAKDGVGVYELPPWAFDSTKRFREAEAMRNAQKRMTSKAQQETMERANRLGLKAAPKLR
jgi:hypothetical protein